MATGFQVAGLASNFDWKTFVDQIMAVERTPADRLETEKTVNNQKANLLGTLTTKLSTLQDAIESLKANTVFGGRTANSTVSASAWSAVAAVNSAVASYKISVSQLASSANLKGATNIGGGINPTSDDVSGLTLANLPVSQAVTAGEFSINGHKVSVALTDSLQDVFAAINTATVGDVTATYDHTTDRVKLTSATGSVMLGAANDTSNFLRALKLGNNGTNVVMSSSGLGTVKTSATLATANLATPITAPAIDGTGAGTFKINGVAITYNVNTDTLASVIQQINQSAAGVSASYDGVNDRMVLSNKSTGDLGVSVSEDTGGLLGAMGLTSGTTFKRGTNAEFSIDGGPTLTSATNTLDAAAHGIEGLTVTVDSVEAQTINVAPDTSTMRTKIDSFITSFNAVQQFLDSNTKVTTDSKGKVTAAALASNREIQEWGRSLRNLAFSAVGGMTGSVARLNDLGIDFTSGTNELQVKDETKLSAALADSTTAVSAFFTTDTNGFAAKLDTFMTKIVSSNTDQASRLTKSNTSLDDQIAAIDRRLAQQRSVMESAFIQMENTQSKLKQQQSSLDSMFAKSSSG